MVLSVRAAGSSPIVVDDVMYTAAETPRSSPSMPRPARKSGSTRTYGARDVGINFWQSEDGKDKRLIFWINSFMQEIDARTGKSIITFGTTASSTCATASRVPRAPGRGVRRQPRQSLEEPDHPRIRARRSWMSPPGDIRAYDVVTGKQVWQFHTVLAGRVRLRDVAEGRDTSTSAGRTTGATMSVDDERGIVYIPTGSATYDFYGADRHGANLFANCLLALDARTGKRLWHFQTVHHDLWDLDNVSAPKLVTVTQNGRRVDAVAHAGKTGFLYVFNRVTGEPLWPIEERPVPKSDVPGE